jgi:hypothetical protein
MHASSYTPSSFIRKNKSNRKNSTKKTSRKLRKNSNQSLLTHVVNPMYSLPDVYTTTLKYSEISYNLDLGTTDFLNRVSLAANNPYDPYTALGGISASYFNKIIEDYRYCRVNHAKIIVKFTNVSIAGLIQTPMQLALVKNAEGVAYSNMNDIISLPPSRCKLSKFFQDSVGSTRVLTMSTNISDIFWYEPHHYLNLIPGSIYDVTNFGGPVSPSRLATVDLYYGRIAGSSIGSAVSCKAEITIEFLCEFRQRIAFSE